MKKKLINGTAGSSLLGVIAMVMFVTIILGAYQLSVQQKIRLYNRILLQEEAYRGAFASVNDTYFWYDRNDSNWYISGEWAQGFDLSTIGQRGKISIELTPGAQPNIMIIKSSCEIEGVVRTVTRIVEAVRDDFREYYTQGWSVSNTPVTQGITGGNINYIQKLPYYSLISRISDYGSGSQFWYVPESTPDD